ncbi:aminoglycoside phosphotransferase family protein [Microvirga sp. 3-52]|uniref:aminoglycoside phosphotransferase family protein n=1 Tax=Microvirga sp. 3-52 TaxID=2792425 RepID=UPI001AC5D092|nr:aminoglycoside phosphotransferase family protein [Microvirga sp. 3-52]MBO1908609.1 aminoglycoside phosphotransferase family protein [Microvirga sp. 3-52]MBS7455054.1 aminoglycoside phosphotransferase family protein [Microvirga sp. 3-52]
MMHDDQVHIDADIVQGLILDQFPEYRNERIGQLGATGTVNAIFRIGSGVAARFPLRAMNLTECAEMLRREAAAIAEFAKHSPFGTPRPLGIGQPGGLYPMPWAVQSWIEGEVATPNGLARSTALALDIANLIASLRAADTHGRRFDGQGRGGNLPDHDDWMEVCFRNSESLLDVARLRHMWARLRELPPSGPDVMSHRDLIPANLLVRDGRLVGVLDAGGFGPADPALDLVAAWHLLDRERRDIVRHHLGSDEVEWKRGAAWAFQQAMGLVWYYQHTNPRMSALGRNTLSRLLEDLIL